MTTYRKKDRLGRWRTLAGHYTSAPRKGAKYVGPDGRWRGPYPKGSFTSPPKKAPKPSHPDKRKPKGKKRRIGPKPAPLPPPREVTKAEAKAFKKRAKERAKKPTLPPARLPAPRLEKLVMPAKRGLSPREWVDKWRPYLERISEILSRETEDASRILRPGVYDDAGEIELLVQVPGGADGLVAQDALHFDGWLTGVEEVVMNHLPKGDGWAQLVLSFANIAPIDEEDPSPMMRSEEPFQVSTIPQDLRGYIAKIWDAARAIQETSSRMQEEKVGWITHAVETITLLLSWGPKPAW